MPSGKLLLEYVYQHEVSHPEKLLLTQPLGGGKVADYSWGRVLDEARRMAAHLQRSGLGGAHIGILSKNCAHFIIAELAIWMAGGTTVAVFPNERPDTIRFVLEHSDARLLFVGKLDNGDKQRSGVPNDMPCIALPLAPPTGFDRWEDVVARTPPLEGQPARAPDDLAMLIYTSGSTGQPKGVMHTFAGITRAVEGIIRTVLQPLGPGEEIRMISYLPLAHVYERSGLECVSLVRGGTRIYFSESLETFVRDLKRARPTVFYSVPRLWVKFQRGVFARIAPAKLNVLLAIPLVHKVVGRKILSGLGLDCVRLAASASAPIPAELIAWYRRLGLNLLEGYGMTEDFGYSHASSNRFNAPGYVGVPYDGVEVRLGDMGEILIKSPGRFVGYYKRPDLDAESFTPDGFFRTGDVGERRADQLLKVTGRIKELFKTAGGEYVAPAPIENMLNAHPMIELSLVSGVGRESAYGMVVLTEGWRTEADNPATKAEVEAALAQLLHDVNQALPRRERLHMLVVPREPWTIDNGCLTPTMKIKRRRIEALVEENLDAWYSAGAQVIWA